LIRINKEIKMRRYFCVFLVLEILVLNACKNALDLGLDTSEPDTPPPDNPSPYEEVVAEIKKLKSNSVLQKIEAFQKKNTEGVFADVDRDKLDLFLNNPEEALKQVEEEENGEAQLAIIDALFDEGTVDDVLEAVDILSPEMAEGLEGMIGELAEALQMSNEEVALPEGISLNRSATDARPNIRQLKLRLPGRPSVPAHSTSESQSAVTRNGITLTKDMEVPSIAAYSGVCVTTAVASFLAESPLPWVRIPAIVVAAGGSTQLENAPVKLLPKLLGVLIPLSRQDEEVIVSTLSTSPEVLEVLAISAVTQATVDVYSVTPTGSYFTRGLLLIWTTQFGVISTMLPEGFRWDLEGIHTPSGQVITNPPPPSI
jgi:hypothetical protein